MWKRKVITSIKLDLCISQNLAFIKNFALVKHQHHLIKIFRISFSRRDSNIWWNGMVFYSAHFFDAIQNLNLFFLFAIRSWILKLSGSEKRIHRCAYILLAAFSYTRRRVVWHVGKKDRVLQTFVCCNRHENSFFVTDTHPTCRGKDSFVRTDLYLVRRINSPALKLFNETTFIEITAGSFLF